MGDKTAIEWTDASWNPFRARAIATGKVGWYCTHKSPGCIGCYAEDFNRRLGTGVDFKPQLAGQVEIFLDEEMLTQPLRWTKPRMIFPCSMTDLFGEFVTNDMLVRIFAVMAATPRHVYQVVTKRPERMALFVARHYPEGLPNVWLGCSIEDQRRADERRPAMAAIADLGWTTWVSYEPALGPVSWKDWEFLAWLVSGGQSGRGARPSHPGWHRAARNFCERNDIAYFFKQWGEWLPVIAVEGPHKPLTLMDYLGRRDDAVQMPPADESEADPYWTAYWFERVGKKVAGRELDGRTHDAMPMRRAA